MYGPPERNDMAPNTNIDVFNLDPAVILAVRAEPARQGRVTHFPSSPRKD